MLAQILGAMCASAVVYGNYKSAIDQYEGGPDIRTVPGYSETASAGIFCTYPAPFMTRTGMFFSEIVSSTILMFMIYALKDEGNIGAGPLIPLCLFFVMVRHPQSISCFPLFVTSTDSGNSKLPSHTDDRASHHSARRTTKATLYSIPSPPF